MIPDLDIGVDLRPVMEYLDLAQRDIRIAAAEALADTAAYVAEGVKENMQDGRFTLRRDWILKGMRASRPGQVDKDQLVAWVWHKDRFMNLQEEGGTKKPKGQHLTIAGQALRGSGASGKTAADTRRIPERYWPSTLKGDRFTFLSSKGFGGKGKYRNPIKSGALALVQRSSKTMQSKRKFREKLGKQFGGRKGALRTRRIWKPEKLRVLYVLSRTGSMAKRMGMKEWARAHAAQVFVTFFEARYAARLARGKAA